MPSKKAQKRGTQSTIKQHFSKTKEKKSAYNIKNRAIHAGLVVNDAVTELLPEELQILLRNCSFTQGVVALIHTSFDSYMNSNGEITHTLVEEKYNYLCRKENRDDNIISRGYWKKREALILDITYKSKNYELILNGCKNERPMIIKRHIREGKYGKSISFEKKIQLPCQLYIYRSVSGFEISK